MQNKLTFKVWGRYALFTDPITKLGGEKFSYQVPTYEALKGIVKSIYWKPTIIWYIDRVRIMKPFRTQTKGVKPLKWNSAGNDLAIYTYLEDIEYVVEAHFEWNMHREELKLDRNEGKHYSIAKRMLERGGRQDIFLGTRECQGYVEPCGFNDGSSYFDEIDNVDLGAMFHSFDYPDETGQNYLRANLWHVSMKNGVIQFPKPQACSSKREIREMTRKEYNLDVNLLNVDSEEVML